MQSKDDIFFKQSQLLPQWEATTATSIKIGDFLLM